MTNSNDDGLPRSGGGAETTRRGLLAGAPLLIMAAPAAGGESNADAELLRLCGQYHANLAAAQAAPQQDDDWHCDMLDAGWEFVHAIEDVRPIGEAGAKAKAGVAASLIDECMPNQFRHGWQRFAYATLREIAGETPVPAIRSANIPDAEVIAACDRLHSLEAERRRLADLEDVLPATQESMAAGVALAELDDEYYDTMSQIVVTPARTLNGMRGKAAAVTAFFDPDFDDDCPGDAMTWSLIRDLTREAQA